MSFVVYLHSPITQTIYRKTLLWQVDFVLIEARSLIQAGDRDNVLIEVRASIRCCTVSI